MHRLKARTIITTIGIAHQFSFDQPRNLYRETPRPPNEESSREWGGACREGGFGGCRLSYIIRPGSISDA